MLLKQVALTIATMLIFCFATVSALAQVGPTIILGGPGGGNINDQCPADHVLTGFNTTKGKDLNSVAAVCQPFVGGKILPSQLGLSTWGKIFLQDGSISGEVGTESALRCGGNSAVEGITVQISRVNIVHTLALTCRDLVTGNRFATYFAGPSVYGGEAARQETADCGGGAIGVGLIGRYGSMVDAVGLLCMVTVAAAPSGAPPAKPIKHTARGGPVTGSPPIKALNGDDGDQNADNGAGDAGGATAATDTTIYDQPAGNDVAYLSGGDPVTIVSCNDDNWCKISRPQKGWVWGDDLDR